MQKSQVIKVAIVDDILRLSEMMQDKLSESESFSVVWHARNGKEALAMLHRNSEIDVLLMDIGMPVMDGIEATRQVIQKWPRIKIIMSTVFDDDEKIFDAILAGASGYLLKDESPKVIRQSIKEVLEGGAPMSSGIARKALQLIRKGKPEAKKEYPDFDITPREKNVLEHLARGETYAKMAESLFISVGTVRTHIENIYRKLQVNNKMQAVQKAKDNKLF